MIKIYLFAVSLFTCVSILSAQAQLRLPMKNIAGDTYYYYEVKNKESLADISRNIGVSSEIILRYNPDANDKLEKKQLLFLPVSFSHNELSPSSQVSNAFGVNQVNVTPSEPIKHTIQSGENIYTIAKQYNTTVEGLMTNNPSLPPKQYIAGEVVMVQPNTALPFYVEKQGLRFHHYTIQDGESFYSIARRNGVTQDDLQAANPDMKKPKKGKIIVVPRAYTEKVLVNMKSVTVSELQAHYNSRIDDLYNELIAQKRANVVNIGIVLPFQLHKDPAPRQGYLYTDFYKGFLLALDSAAYLASKQINVHVWDTQHNLNVTDSLLALPEMRELDLLIAPSEPKQLERMNKFGQENRVNVVNCFTTKNNDYLENTHVVQVNTPTPQFSERVQEWFDRQFEGYHVIYLMDASSEGKEIFDNLRDHIGQAGMPSSSLSVNGELSFDNLSRLMNPGTQYVLLPSSSSKELLQKIMKAMKHAKKERIDCEFVLVGYPEYVTYLQDYQTDLQEIDTYVFSRFFNTKGFRTRDVEALYRKSFNGEMLNSVPNMTLYGFDLGMYIINTLGNGIGINDESPLYRGVQTSFKFERSSNWGGLINRAIDIIHFSTDHKITKYVQQ